MSGFESNNWRNRVEEVKGDAGTKAVTFMGADKINTLNPWMLNAEGEVIEQGDVGVMKGQSNQGINSYFIRVQTDCGKSHLSRITDFSGSLPYSQKAGKHPSSVDDIENHGLNSLPLKSIIVGGKELYLMDFSTKERNSLSWRRVDLEAGEAIDFSRQVRPADRGNWRWD